MDLGPPLPSAGEGLGARWRAEPILDSASMRAKHAQLLCRHLSSCRSKGGFEKCKNPWSE